MIEARDRARYFASRDKVVTTPLDNTLDEAEIIVRFPSEYRIRVTTQRTVPLFFARVLGHDNQLISATAVAEAAIADTGVQCLKPWGIPIPWNDDGDYLFEPPGEQVIPMDCVVGPYKMILKIGSPYNQNDQLDLPSLQQEPGHFFGLALCGDTGADDFRERIRNICLDNCAVSLHEQVPLEPGNMMGPTRQAVRELLDADRGAHFDNNTNKVVPSTSYPDYTKSPRFVKVPLYDPNEVLSQGRSTLTVEAFGGFWLEDLEDNNKTVTGYYLGEIAPGGKSSSGPGSGPVLRILRLVE